MVNLEAVEDGVEGVLDIELASADVIDSLVIDHNTAVSVCSRSKWVLRTELGLKNNCLDLRVGVGSRAHL